ncbi:unnamed protein product, partial [Didymodactylos carnosus]
MSSNTCLRDSLLCPVCLDLFVEPRILPCSHTFCSACLRPTPTPLTNFLLICPVCRYYTFNRLIPLNRIVRTLVEQYKQQYIRDIDDNDQEREQLFAKCFICKKCQHLKLCWHCDTLLCVHCHEQHDNNWKNAHFEMTRLLLSKIYSITFELKC